MINQKTGYIHEKSQSNEDLRHPEAFESHNFYDDDQPKNIQIGKAPSLKAAAPKLTQRSTSRAKSLGRVKSAHNSSMASLKEPKKSTRLRGSTSAQIPRKNLKAHHLFSTKPKEEARPKSLSKKRFPPLRTAATIDKTDELAAKLKRASKEVGRSNSAMSNSMD
mmetsp:Transcript_14826/g.22991  ORF Transcript_14826/g.22991 Transcript_14826/m.22991 type:complete len:164 (-) Transcript_14826:456-947(-)